MSDRLPDTMLAYDATPSKSPNTKSITGIVCAHDIAMYWTM